MTGKHFGIIFGVGVVIVVVTALFLLRGQTANTSVANPSTQRISQHVPTATDTVSDPVPEAPVQTQESELDEVEEVGLWEDWFGSSESDPASEPVNVTEPEPEKPDPVPLGTVSAWVYPGPPACGALQEAMDGRGIDVLKVEYFSVRDGGVFELFTEDDYGCNGYSTTSAAQIRALSREQFITVSSAYARDMAAFLAVDNSTGEYTDQIVALTVAEEFTGVEIDFEDFGGWSAADYAAFKEFITRLGNELHGQGKELMIDMPPVSNATEEAWYQIRLPDLIDLPIDHVVIMAYDYQFDHGSGAPVAPLEWISDIVAFTLERYPYPDQLSIGVPSYGYQARISGGPIQIKTKEQLENVAGFSGAERDVESMEMMWRNRGVQYVYQDSESIQAKVDTILESGVGNVSIWHLGGNDWFFDR